MMSPSNEHAAWAFSLLPFATAQIPQIVTWRLRALQDIWGITAQQAEKYHDATYTYISTSMQQGTLTGVWAAPADNLGIASSMASGEMARCAYPGSEAQRQGYETAGCVALLLHDEMPAPDNATGRCAYVTNLFVMPPWRGHGAGYALMQWATQEALRRGCGKIFLEANPPAQGIFSALGYEEMGGYLRLH